MIKGLLSYQKGSYRKFFIFVLIISFCMFIYTSFNKNVSFSLILLSLFLGVLKQVFIPINLDQNIFFSKGKKHMSDDDFINVYNSNSINDCYKHNIWYRLIILGEKISFPICIAGILYSIFI